MTSGSWTISDGVNYTDQSYFSSKFWSGGDGKTETWPGGIRAKWNNYSMEHQRFTCVKPQTFHGYGVISDKSVSSLQSRCKWTANDDLALLDKLARAVRGHQFDLGVNIAEASKTYSSIVGNLRSIGTALVSLKHGNIAGAFRQLGVPSRRQRRLRAKDVSGRWLEMQYGWIPLVSQSFEAAKALEAITGPRVLRFRASSATKHGSYDGTQNPFTWGYPVAVSYSKRLLAELSEDLSLQRSLALVDPLQIAWELVPYSFVVDWFIPVGTYLSAWAIIPRLQGRFLTTTRVGQKAGAVEPRANWIANPLWKNLNKHDQWFKIDRVVSSSLSMPTPTFKPVPKALSPRHLLNAVALIHQLL